jgi:hypothetical protein
MTQDCKIPINTNLPLKLPYRTGSYLVDDYTPPKGVDPSSPAATNFRMGTKIGLRASGSHQVDVKFYANILKTVAGEVPREGRFFVVDLRQESHLFFDGRAVSWYADKDWSNVGQSLDWIIHDESCRIDMSRGKTVQIFTTQENESDGSVTPIDYCEAPVKYAAPEEEVINLIESGLDHRHVIYERIPVSDHCRPTMDAANAFINLIWNLNPQETWIHFHCHGGDGRTTSFLAMYDMFCVAKSGIANFPNIDQFAQRQKDIFDYNLNPFIPLPGCNENTRWKCGLAKERWRFLIAWHKWLADGALKTGKPFEFKETAP